MAPNQRGIAKVTGEGTMWTLAHRLSHLNGGRWKVEGEEVNTTKETVEVRGNFIISNI
jgi:malate synthase